MKHFLDIEHLQKDEIEGLIARANYFKQRKAFNTASPKTVAQLFYENSTRTRVSFEMAAKNLGMRVVNIDLQHSSEKKGETLIDTVANLHAMGIDYFVLRHSQERLVHQLSETLQARKVHFINAGDGQHAHPSQALLDVMTILAYKPSLANVKIALVGNLKHSRVANSLQQLLKIMGCKELVMVSPEIWRPERMIHGRSTHSLHEGLAKADVVIALRVQTERLASGEEFDLDTYHKEYAITASSLALAHQDAIVMHPGPVNRGVEIDASVVDGPSSKILQQVTNGVYMRMAILEALGVCE